MKKIKMVRQHDSRDCGAACLCMIIKFFGGNYSIQQLRKIIGTSQDGVSLYGLVDGARKIGLVSNSYKGSVKDLKEFLGTDFNPVILHYKNNHFVLLVGYDDNIVYINDPAVGKCKCLWSELEKNWSGYIVTFEKNEELPRVKDNENRSLIFNMIKKNKKALLLTALFSILIVGMTIAGTYVFQMLIDFEGVLGEMYEHNKSNIVIKLFAYLSGNSMLALGCVLTIMFVFMSVLFWIRGNIIAYVSKKIDIELVENYFDRIYTSIIRDFSSRMEGEYIARISDLILVRRLITEVIVEFVLNIFLILVSVYALVKTNYVLFSFALIMIGVYVVVVIMMNKPFKNVNYNIMEKSAEMQSYFKETLQGYEVIKANNVSGQIKRKLLNKYNEYENSLYKGNLLAIFSGSISILIEQLCNIFIIFVGFDMVNNGQLSLGELMTFYMLVSCLITPVKDILSSQSIIQGAFVALERIKDIDYMEKEEIKYKSKKIDNSFQMELDKVSFGYKGKSELIKSVSFLVDKKKKIVIKGKNGTGKSTLLKLIMGFEKPVEGKIKVNGVDVSEYGWQQIRDKISYVEQRNFLFADTIRNNITLGNVNITDEEITEVVQQMGLNKFIDEMPMGYDTYINEGGENLSVGQRQTIVLTRALLRKPKLLILDEATSNMDYERTGEVMDYVFKLPIPCIIVSHDMDIIKKADEVICL